jgi:hypothetical protein
MFFLSMRESFLGSHLRLWLTRKDSTWQKYRTFEFSIDLATVPNSKRLRAFQALKLGILTANFIAGLSECLNQNTTVQRIVQYCRVRETLATASHAQAHNRNTWNTHHNPQIIRVVTRAGPRGRKTCYSLVNTSLS